MNQELAKISPMPALVESVENGSIAEEIGFEPGDKREINLVPFAGKRAVYGFNGLVNGPLD